MTLRLLLRGGGLVGKFLLFFAISSVLGLPATATYGMAVALSVVASKVCGLGVSIEAVRQVSAGECGLATPVTAIGASAAVACFVAFIAFHSLPSALGLDARSATTLLSLVISEYVSYEVNNLVFSVRRPDLGAALAFAKTGGWALPACMGLWGGFVTSIDGVLLLWLTTNIAVTAVATVVVARALRSWGRRSSLRELLIDGFPFYASAVMVALSQYLDRFVLARFVSSHEMGRYVLSWSTANVVQALTYAMVSVVALPDLARNSKAKPGLPLHERVCGNRWVARAAVTAGCLYVLVVMTTCVAQIMVPDRVRGLDVPVVSLTGVAFVMRSVQDIMFGGLIAYGYRKIALMSAAASLVMSVPTYWGLITLFGPFGAALGAVVVSMVGVVLVYLISRRRDRGSHAG